MNGEKDMQRKELRQAIELMKQGEEKGFNYIYGETYNFVYSRARLAINDEQEVQDLVQEVYVAAYRNIQSLKDADSLYAWLGSITMRQGAKMANRKKKHVLLSEEKQGMFEEIPDESVKLESDAISKENAVILKELLEKLSPEQKSVIVSFYYDGLKVEQIAEMTETSAGTIKSRLHLARKRLQEYIVELEKKERCSLRGFSAPLLLLAMKMLLEETTLSKASAQGIYNQVCTQVGAKASALAFQSTGAGNIVMANSGKTAGMGNEWKMGLTGQMKGQGTGMNKLFGKLAGLGKVKLASIAVGVVVVAGVGVGAGVYVHNQAQVEESQAKLDKEEKKEEQDAKEKEQEALLAELTERYEKAEELRDNLILEDAVIQNLNTEFEEIKTALDKGSVDEETEETMTTLEAELEDYRKQNEKYLTEKEAAMYDYHTELFPEEKQKELDNMLAEYQTLFEAVKYKDADKKLDEMNSTMVAFMNENYPDETTEVAENTTSENSGNAPGNTGSTNTGNSNTGDNNSANTASENSNTGNGGNNTNSGSGTSNNNDGENNNSGSSSETSTPTARWADGRCTEVENDIIANTSSSGMEAYYNPFMSQFESIAASFVAGSLSSGQTEQQIADIVLNNTDLPVVNVKAVKNTYSGSSYTKGSMGLGGCGWYYLRVYYDSATDTLTIYSVTL